ncbi:MAG: tubulin-like doman-containing protein [Candidatus Nanopelagicaceae bacterium]
MLQPFLLVGVGGSGGKTLRAVKHALELRLQQEDWEEGWPKAWQLLHIDTPTAQDGAEFPAPFLDPENYLGLVSTGTEYKQAHGSALSKVPSQYVAEVQKSLPPAEKVKVSLYAGAGKFRAIGRTVVLAKLSEVVTRAQEAIARMSSEGAISQLSQISTLFGGRPGTETVPVVIVVSSIAGGSGAGQYIEVTEAIKNAAKGQPWTQTTFSILYAPDVFKSVGETDVIAGNALFAMSESMANMWSNDLPASTAEVYKNHGITIPNLGISEQVHIGPKFNYVIGRQNSKVTFTDQPDVYKAVAASIATWMTDEKVQGGLQAYTVANWDANSGALSLTDKSELKVANSDTPPFASLGFGRVSLGRDKFTDYTAERLTKTAIDRMLNAHINDASNPAKTVQELVEDRARQTIGQFIIDMGFARKSDAEFEVINVTRPVRDGFLADFKSEIKGIASQAVSAKTLTQSASAWVENLSAAYELRYESAQQYEQAMREERLRNWVRDYKLRTLKVVSRSASQVGLKVTVELLKRFSSEVETQIGLINRVRETYMGYGSDYRGAIGASLQAVQGGTGLKEDHEAISVAIENAKNVLWYNLDSKFHAAVAELLNDFLINFIAPLRDALTQGELGITKLTERPVTETVQNAYKNWPNPNSEAVPLKYKPAPNEYLLVETSEYPSEYSRLINESVTVNRRTNAVQVVTDEVLMGALELDDLDSAHRWQLVAESRQWIPLEPAYRADRSQAPQVASFDFATDPDEYLRRTHLWLNRKGQNFYRYLHEDLASFLDVNQRDQSVLISRQDQFKKMFLEAARASEPLVKLNPALLQEVHNASIEERDTVVSVLPFDLNSPSYNMIKEILNSNTIGIWKDQTGDSWFNPSARVQSIDIFSIQRPYQPVVMDSIFSPIADSWGTTSDDMDKRADFLKWRRSRLLFETVPASPQKKFAMLRGWYVTKILNLLEEVPHSEPRGPELKVWSGKTYTYESFPHPLANDGIVETHDYPGGILNSLAIALTLCNAKSSLQPMYAYQRLMEVGDISSKTNSELALWLTKGELKYQGQPEPKPERAGQAKSSSLEDRRKVVLAFLEEESNRFKKDIESLDPREQKDELNLTWEIRDAIRKSLNDLIAFVKSVESIQSGI